MPRRWTDPSITDYPRRDRRSRLLWSGMWLVAGVACLAAAFQPDRTATVVRAAFGLAGVGFLAQAGRVAATRTRFIGA